MLKHPLLVGAVLTALLVAIGAGASLRKQAAIGEQPSNAVERENKDTEQRDFTHEKLSPRGAQSSADSTSDERECQSCTEHEKADLHEQRRMAKAAERQVFVAVAGSVFVLLSVVFAGWAAWAASDAARQAARAVDIQTRIEGPVLHVHAIKCSPKVPNTIHPIIKNSGKTAAVLIEASVNCVVKIGTLPPLPAYPVDPQPLNQRLLEKDKTSDLYCGIPGDGLKPLFEKGMPTALWGYVLYEDIFGRIRRMGFGFRCDYSVVLPDDSVNLDWRRAGGDAYNYDREGFQQS
jgi:hypothetical protein